MNNLSYRIYKNLEIFLEYRKLELLSHVQKDSDGWFGEEEFLSLLHSDGYVLIECKDLFGNLTYIYLLEIDSEFETDSKKIRALIKKTPNYNNNNLTILLVSKNPFDIHRSKAARGMSNENTELQFILYRHLISNPFDHHNSQLHRIMSEEEIMEVLEWFRVDKSFFQKIKRNERPMIWLNPRVGDMICIEGEGDSGAVINYRVVVN